MKSSPRLVRVAWARFTARVIPVSSTKWRSKSCRFDLRTGKRTRIATVRPPDPAGDAALSVDSISRGGKIFAYRYATALSILYVISGLH